MRLSDAELMNLRTLGLYITEKCDACGRILNQSHGYTMARKPEVFCTAACRDKFHLGELATSIIQGTRCYRCRGRKTPGQSMYCGKCQPYADPYGKPVAGANCDVCGQPVPVLRQASGSDCCSARCAETRKKRRQREAMALA